MYKDFYGLKEEPFSLTSDPRFLYWSQKHQEAFRHLVYSVQSNKGLAALTGEPGAGKTAILHAVIEHLRKIYPGVHIALLVNSNINVQELFHFIFDEFQLRSTADNKSAYLIHLKNFLSDNHRKNEKSVLILDEAQNFHPTVLEEIRLLSNMQSASENLLNIFLVGQPRLLESINSTHLYQLKQRLGIIYTLLPLNRLETERYIHKRLSVAGAQQVDLFAPEALNEIFIGAKGLPRLINVICDNALLFGCATQAYPITRDIIRRVTKNMDIPSVETIATGSGVVAHALVSPAPVPQPVSPLGEVPVLPASQSEPPLRGETDADRIILQRTLFSKENYWNNLIKDSPGDDKNLVRTWQEAAVREAQRRGRRLLVICLLLLGLLGGAVSQQLGLWSLPGWMEYARTTPPPQAPLPRATLPTTPSDHPPDTPGEVVTPGAPAAVSPGTETTSLAAPAAPPGQATTPAVPQQAPGTASGTVYTVKKGDTLSKILIQAYGDYNRTVLDLVRQANPSLHDIERLEIGQQLVLPPHAERE